MRCALLVWTIVWIVVHCAKGASTTAASLLSHVAFSARPLSGLSGVASWQSSSVMFLSNSLDSLEWFSSRATSYAYPNSLSFSYHSTVKHHPSSTQLLSFSVESFSFASFQPQHSKEVEAYYVDVDAQVSGETVDTFSQTKQLALRTVLALLLDMSVNNVFIKSVQNARTTVAQNVVTKSTAVDVALTFQVVDGRSSTSMINTVSDVFTTGALALALDAYGVPMQLTLVNVGVGTGGGGSSGTTDDDNAVTTDDNSVTDDEPLQQIVELSSKRKRNSDALVGGLAGGSVILVLSAIMFRQYNLKRKRIMLSVVPDASQ